MFGIGEGCICHLPQMLQASPEPKAGVLVKKLVGENWLEKARSEVMESVHFDRQRCSKFFLKH